MQTIPLSGCAPVPLAHYLKALGVLRVLSLQVSDSITCRWDKNQLMLSGPLTSEQLLDFFIQNYRPTPIAVPWSGGDFFDVKVPSKEAKWDKCPTSSRVIESVLATTSDRLNHYRETLHAVLHGMKECGVDSKKTIEGNGTPQRTKKADMLRILRNQLSDEALGWIDAAAVIEDEAPYFNPMLGGGGGSDGNSHFSDNYMQSLWMCLADFDPQRGKPVPALGGTTFDSRAALAESLFAILGRGTRIDQLSPVLFDSTRVGGPNQKTGFEAKAGSNPWDFILMLEGAILFAGSLGKKLNEASAPSARFPFIVNSSPTGRGSSYLGESSGREAWLPVWSKPVSLAEVTVLMSEGRLQKHGRMAKYGTDAFVALAQHGHSSGIDAFQRVGFFKGRIGGDNYFTAVDQGLYKCHRRTAVDVFRDVDGALHDLRNVVQSDKCPSAIKSAVVRLDDAIAKVALGQSSIGLQQVVIAIGRTESALANSHKWAEKAFISPLYGLRPEWLDCPNTTEFRLARSLAGLRCWLGKGDDKGTFWLRQQLEPVQIVSNQERQWVSWDKNPSNDVTWQEGNLTDCLNAILTRRIQRVEQAGVEGWPDWSPYYAKLDDISAFIERRTDDALLADLLWGFSLLDWQSIGNKKKSARTDGSVANQTAEPDTTREDETPEQEDQDIPNFDWRSNDEKRHRVIPSSFYALLRLCFHPGKDNRSIPLVPAIHQRARNGAGLAASQLAARRLLASGEAPLVRELQVSSETARRTAAALLFPLSPRDIKLLKLTTQHQSKQQNA